MEKNLHFDEEYGSATGPGGLTEAEAQKRKAEGKSNKRVEVKTKSVGRIFKENLCTFFNAINLALAIIVVSVGAYRNAFFMGIIICNAVIGTFQELRSRHAIRKLSLISAPKAHVLREGKERDIETDELVLGDVAVFRAGDQICADFVVTSGECSVDESLLTGESDQIEKGIGDELSSGTFVVSGSVHAQAIRVGEDSTAAKIMIGASGSKKTQSEILRSVRKLIKFIGILVIPVGLLLFANEYIISDQELSAAVSHTVAAMIGMIPEGLVLLTSVVMAMGTIRLSRKKTLVQDLYCIETLARVDTLCLDKTGTITEGSIVVEEILPLDDSCDAAEVLGAIVANLDDNNATFNAMREFTGGESDWTAVKIYPFSSKAKWSGADFGERGKYAVGASEYLLDADETLTEKLSEYQSRGKRVLILTKCGELITDARPEAAVPIAIIVMKDAIRKEAPETLAFFEREDVDIKVISGDNALTVSRVAEAAGLKNANKYIDVSGLSDDELAEAATRYSVFGRVTPDQKLVLIKALKAKGRTVAMTGDGVNDVLALREADCSIAVASGSDAARNASQIVLLDSNFGSMYNVVMEGRRAINNLERSSVMFIIKTTYSTLLAFLFVFLPGSYPFVPIQLTLITSLIVGFPSFVLAFQPNKNRIRGNFLVNILSRALSMGVAAALGVVLVTQIGNLLSLSTEQISTICVLFVAAVTYAALAQACWKPNLLRGILLAMVLVVFVLAVTITGPFFYIEPMTLTMWILLAVLVATLPLLVRVGDVVDKKYALRKLSQAIEEE